LHTPLAAQFASFIELREFPERHDTKPRRHGQRKFKGQGRRGTCQMDSVTNRVLMKPSLIFLQSNLLWNTTIF